LELTIAERILEFIIDVAADLAEICDCDTGKLIFNLINKPNSKLAIVKLYEKVAI